MLTSLLHRHHLVAHPATHTHTHTHTQPHSHTATHKHTHTYIHTHTHTTIHTHARAHASVVCCGDGSDARRAHLQCAHRAVPRRGRHNGEGRLQAVGVVHQIARLATNDMAPGVTNLTHLVVLILVRLTEYQPQQGHVTTL